MELIALALALCMGLVLGFMGAGGSMLTVPIFVYLLGIKPELATGYSLLIVGVSSFVGAFAYWRHQSIHVSAAFFFFVPAMLAVWLARGWLMPAIPNPVMGLSKGSFIMLLYASLLMLTATFMLCRNQPASMLHHWGGVMRHALLLLAASVVGLLTGVLGAGGGFIIVPVLVWIFGLPIKTAVGTSLLIIGMNAMAGFKFEWFMGSVVNIWFLMLFLLLTVLGMQLGIRFSRTTSSAGIQKVFAWFTLAMGIFIALKEAWNIGLNS